MLLKSRQFQFIHSSRSVLRQRFAVLVAGAATGFGLMAIASGAQAQGTTRSGLDEASTGTWAKLTNQPAFQTDTALLLTDGTVMVHQYSSQNWWRLTPDNTGSYLNGTWSQLGSMASNYGPLYFASAVLADGRVIVEGGEYNFGVSNRDHSGRHLRPGRELLDSGQPTCGMVDYRRLARRRAGRRHFHAGTGRRFLEEAGHL